MQCNVPFFLHQLGEPGRRPQFRGKTKFGWVVLQPAQHDFLLRVCQLSRSARDRLRGQGTPPALANGRNPPTHTTTINAEKVRYFLGRISFEHATHCKTTSMLKFHGCAFVSHALAWAKVMPGSDITFVRSYKRWLGNDL